MTISTELLSTIKKWALVIIVIALMLCATVIFFMSSKISKLKAEKLQQAEQIGMLTTVTKTNQLTIEKLTKSNTDNQNALVELRQKDAQMQIEINNQTNIFLGLLNENAQLKDWANTALPADVISLFSRTKNSDGSQNY